MAKRHETHQALPDWNLGIDAFSTLDKARRAAAGHRFPLARRYTRQALTELDKLKARMRDCICHTCDTEEFCLPNTACTCGGRYRSIR